MFEICFSESVDQELKKFRVRDQRIILDAIEKQLRRDPEIETRKRKKLECLVPPFEAIPPIWELRVGEFRVFYDVDREQKIVLVRAIRRKPAHKTIGEAL